MPSCRLEVLPIDFGCKNFRLAAQDLRSSYRLTPISTFAPRQHVDFGRRSKSAPSVPLFFPYLSSVGSGSYSRCVHWMDGWKETAIAQSRKACLGNIGFLTELGKLMICAAGSSAWSKQVWL